MSYFLAKCSSLLEDKNTSCRADKSKLNITFSSASLFNSCSKKIAYDILMEDKK